jgi:hypothetical protein
MSGPHKYSSLSYKISHEAVRKALKHRSYLNNTAQISMPFLKATTTVVNEDFLGKDNLGFTLGMHAIDMDVRYQDIFSNTKETKDKQYPLCGYTYTKQGKNQLVYANATKNDNALKLNKLFDAGSDLFSTTSYPHEPPPGITKATITRGKNGLLIAGQIDFSVPTLSQLELLMRVFLVPGMGMVLEWGQQFAVETINNKDGDFGERGLIRKNIDDYMFPWHDRAKLEELLKRLGEKTVGVEEIMNCYVYPTEGQYMWMFGRIGNFSTKANSDGSFDCTVKIVGPSEDSWAFSTTQTVTPPADPSTKKPCVQDTNSVHSFFTKTTSGANLKTILDDVRAGRGKAAAWKSHVKYFPKPSGKEGEANKDTTNPNESEKLFGDSEDAYFMSWRFFVNVVLNHPEVGVLQIFSDAKVDPEVVKRIALIQPYRNGPNRDTPLLSEPGPKYIDDPHEAFVGYNKFLRSIDPSTMLIISEKAAVEAEATMAASAKRQEKNAPDFFKVTGLAKSFKEVGVFEESTSAVAVPAVEGGDKLDRGLLSAGVWINHKAVVQAMAGAETILRGVSNLLERMSRASNGYWNLTLDSIEPTGYSGPTCLQSTPGKDNSTFAWTVIDSNFRENSENSVKEFLNNVHVFNKHVRKNSEGKLVGSEVIDCNVDLALPKILFSQIATMGLVQQKDLAAATGVDGGDKAETKCSDAVIGDANEALRELFAITSIAPSAKAPNVSPDFTLASSKVVGSQCPDTNSSTPASATGQGAQVDGANANSVALPAAGEPANREFPGMENAFRYIEMFPEMMTANIRCQADGKKSNAFGASPGALSINADLTLPGLAGFRIGELFWIDRIPTFYKAFGAFQTVSIEDTIDISNGWQTKIGAKFNYLGAAWKEAIINLADFKVTASEVPSGAPGAPTAPAGAP